MSAARARGSEVDTAEGVVLDLTVGPVAHGGHCVARPAEGRVVFVRHALPGERVRAVVTEERTGYVRADAIEILEASPDRVAPPCPWAGPDRCGGCDFQHVRPAAQRELKAAVVREQLQRLGGLSSDEIAELQIAVRDVPVPGAPEGAASADGLGWRTRVRYTVDLDGRAGLLKHRSHEVVPVDRCRIAHPRVQAAPVTGVSWPDQDTVEVVASGAGDVTLLGTRSSRVSDVDGDDLLGGAPVGSPGRRPRPRPTLLAGPARVHERAIGREWTVPAESFWQVHPAAADTLAATVVELLGPRPAERAWDLYGGVGLFAGALAPHLTGTGRITLVEADPRATAAATANLADLTTVTVLRSDVEHALGNPRWRSVDLVVLDPPRTGAGRAVVELIISRSPRAVAYVACDPAALARDTATFRAAGWRLTVLRAFDLFPMTHHVECVALFVPPAGPSPAPGLAAPGR